MLSVLNSNDVLISFSVLINYLCSDDNSYSRSEMSIEMF